MIFREMTVARIREPKGADYVEVVFLESARFYRLARSHPAFDAALRHLRAAGEGRAMLSIGLTSLDSDVIEEVTPSRHRNSDANR